MFENPVALRASKENLLRTKVKSFRENYSQSLQRTQTKSSLQNLASTIYTHKYNKEFSPAKKNRPTSASNPEHKINSPAIKGMDIRVQHVPNMSDINTELLLEKRRLQQKIQFIKEEIARQTRARNRSETNWRLLRNEKDQCYQSYSEYCRKSEKLNEGIAEVRNDNSQLRQDIHKLQKQNAETNKRKQHEAGIVNELITRVNILKNELMVQEKERAYVKAELLKEQRVMDSFSIMNKELQNERAMLMIEINETVHRHKL